MTISPVPKSIACSQCFVDRGLALDAEQIGTESKDPCSNCGSLYGRKLSIDDLGKLAYRFFVWGSVVRCDYGAAPVVQFNQHQKTSISVSPWLVQDVALLEKLLGVGFFHYGPRLWMVGEVEPLKALQKAKTRSAIIERILREYPEVTVGPDESFYRIRVAPQLPDEPSEYDSPPPQFAGKGRLDSTGWPVLYVSPDLELCVHECRVTAEDELYVATLRPKAGLRLLNLSALLKEEEHVDEFESLDMAIHMLFLAGKHSYRISRTIAMAAFKAGFQGLIYPSYFSLLKIGTMPFPTTYGISHRRFPSQQQYEEMKSVPNLAIFGRPIESGLIEVQCINKLIIRRVGYELHFGPVKV